MSQRLPVRPNLDQLRRHAKIALRVARADGRDWRLADAQRAVARGFGYDSWAVLKRHVVSTHLAATASKTPKASPLSARADTGNHDNGFEGVWVSEAERRTVLAIDQTDGAIVLTSSPAIKTDGRSPTRWSSTTTATNIRCRLAKT